MPEGIPRTEKERQERHQEAYGTTQTPPRGTGLGNRHIYPPKSTVEIQQTDVSKALYLAALQTIRINSIHQWEKTTRTTAAAAVTTVTIKMDNEDDRIYVVTHVAATDLTTTGKTIELYNVKADQRHLLNSDVMSAAAVTVGWDGELITGPNQSIVAVFTTPTASDKLLTTVSGYWVPK